MRITPYLQNAQMLREQQQVIHQQNLKELQRLNHQKEQCVKKIMATHEWAKAGRVDVLV